MTDIANKIIVMGPIHTGKTVFLTCLYVYGSRWDPEYVISVEKGEEIIIGKNLRRLLRKKWPEKTGRRELNSITLNISQIKPNRRFMQKKEIILQIPDYAGELLTLYNSPTKGILEKIRTGEELSEEQKEIVKLIKDSRGYIVVVDPTLHEVADEDSEEYDRTLLEMDYDTLINQLSKSEASYKPILVLVTKWDLINEASYEKYIEENYRAFWRSIKNRYPKNRLDFQGVGLKTDNDEPIVPLQLIGYKEVLKWIIKIM